MGSTLCYAGPLFIHQLSHVWIDVRAIQDDAMRGRGLDYFENRRPDETARAADRAHGIMQVVA